MITIHDVRVCSLVSLSTALYTELRDLDLQMPHAAGVNDRYCVYLDELVERSVGVTAAIHEVADDLMVTTFNLNDRWAKLADAEWLEVVGKEQGGCGYETEFTRVCAAITGRSMIPFMERLRPTKGENRFVGFSSRSELVTVEVVTRHPRVGQVWKHCAEVLGDSVIALTSRRLMCLSGQGDDLDTPYRGAIRAARERASCAGCAQPHYSARK